MAKKPLIIAVLILLVSLFAFRGKMIEVISHQKDIDPQAVTGEYNPELSTAKFNSKTITVPPADLESIPTVLGNSNARKRIEVDLTRQRLYTLEDNVVVHNFLISSGLWGKTPTGTYHIWTKLRYTKMEGGNKAINTYYYLPNVPFTMFFYNEDIPKHRGYALHGTYWHNNFGHPMSHGCINMRTEEAAITYYWANPELGDKRSVFADADNPGTEITIYGEAPWN